MSDAVQRLHVDDLDAAWRAALRGDVDGALKRIAPSVAPREATTTGTPWRMTGWLAKRS